MFDQRREVHEEHIPEIAVAYGLSVDHMQLLSGGQANTNYLLRTPQGRYVLTVYNRESFDNVLAHAQLLQWLAAHGYQTTRVVPTVTGELVTSYGENPVMLKEYIEGSIRRTLDAGMLWQLGVSTAKLHQIPVPDFIRSEHSYSSLFETVINNPQDRQFGSWLDTRLQTTTSRMPLQLPRCIVHSDIFGDNTLFKEGRLQAIIDFESACYHFRAFDIGMAIVGTCIENTTVALDKARSLLSGYAEIQTLDRDELNSLPLFVEYAAICTACWRFWKYRIDMAGEHESSNHPEMVAIAENAQDLPETLFVDLPNPL